MAWTLFGFDFDLYTLLLPVGKAIGGAVCGFLFKKVIGCFMSETARCKIKTCRGFGTPATRGLCQVCYKAAKAKVQNGETTWNALVSVGLCDLLESEKSRSAFDDAFQKAMEDTQ